MRAREEHPERERERTCASDCFCSVVHSYRCRGMWNAAVMGRDERGQRATIKQTDSLEGISRPSLTVVAGLEKWRDECT